MKKVIFFLLFSLFMTRGYSQILYGVKAGVNIATVTGNDVDDPKFHPSFYVGGFVNFLLKEKFTLQPEILFSGKGVKSDERTYNFGYINVPVLLQYNTESGFFVEAGPQVGFLTNAKVKYNAGGSQDVKNSLRSVDFSWVGGIGYKMVRGFGVNVRYDFGFYNIANAGIIRNKTIMVGLLYTFGHAKE